MPILIILTTITNVIILIYANDYYTICIINVCTGEGNHDCQVKHSPTRTTPSILTSTTQLATTNPDANFNEMEVKHKIRLIRRQNEDLAGLKCDNAVCNVLLQPDYQKLWLESEANTCNDVVITKILTDAKSSLNRDQAVKICSLVRDSLLQNEQCKRAFLDKAASDELPWPGLEVKEYEHYQGSIQLIEFFPNHFITVKKNRKGKIKAQAVKMDMSALKNYKQVFTGFKITDRVEVRVEASTGLCLGIQTINKLQSSSPSQCNTISSPITNTKNEALLALSWFDKQKQPNLITFLTMELGKKIDECDINADDTTSTRGDKKKRSKMLVAQLDLVRKKFNNPDENTMDLETTDYALLSPELQDFFENAIKFDTSQLHTEQKNPQATHADQVGVRLRRAHLLFGRVAGATVKHTMQNGEFPAKASPDEIYIRTRFKNDFSDNQHDIDLEIKQCIVHASEETQAGKFIIILTPGTNFKSHLEEISKIEGSIVIKQYPTLPGYSANLPAKAYQHVLKLSLEQPSRIKHVQSFDDRMDRLLYKKHLLNEMCETEANTAIDMYRSGVKDPWILYSEWSVGVSCRKYIMAEEWRDFYTLMQIIKKNAKFIIPALSDEKRHIDIDKKICIGQTCKKSKDVAKAGMCFDWRKLCLECDIAQLRKNANDRARHLISHGKNVDTALCEQSLDMINYVIQRLIPGERATLAVSQIEKLKTEEIKFIGELERQNLLDHEKRIRDEEAVDLEKKNNDLQYLLEQQNQQQELDNEKLAASLQPASARQYLQTSSISNGSDPIARKNRAIVRQLTIEHSDLKRRLTVRKNIGILETEQSLGELPAEKREKLKSYQDEYADLCERYPPDLLRQPSNYKEVDSAPVTGKIFLFFYFDISFYSHAFVDWCFL